MGCYAEELSQAVRHLEQLRIPVHLERGSVVSDEAVTAAERALGLPLPRQLADFYRDIGDGLEIAWEINNVDWPAGAFDVLSLDDLVSHNKFVAEFYIDRLDAYDYPYVDNPQHERDVAHKKRRWLDFQDQVSRFTLVLDCNDPQAPVRYNDHLWWSCQPNADDQGRLVAPDFRSFYSGLASVCFQQPRSVDFTVLSPTGVDWRGDEFSREHSIA